MILGFLFTYGLAILLCWHAMRTGRDTFWIWILLMAPGIGPIVYIALNVIPSTRWRWSSGGILGSLPGGPTWASQRGAWTIKFGADPRWRRSMNG